jgi:hypothetical protein
LPIAFHRSTPKLRLQEDSSSIHHTSWLWLHTFYHLDPEALHQTPLSDHLRSIYHEDGCGYYYVI